VYEGIRLTSEQIVTSARDEGVHLIGLSILSGSHLRLVPEVMAGLKAEGLHDIPVVVGGIIPEDDAVTLRQAGVARVYTPKDFEMLRIVSDMVDVAEAAAAHS
jgi:(2R)-ethylmalonyl-CoA mutase